MVHWEFSQEDLQRMKALGISERQIQAQKIQFERLSGYLSLKRPCTVGDGIQKISEGEIYSLMAVQEEAAKQGRFIKFVPASGAATRMFKRLLSLYHDPTITDSDILGKDCNEEESKTGQVRRFIQTLEQFPFFSDLKVAMARDGLDIDAFKRKMAWRKILEYLLTERGLNYLKQPKGLHKFHIYSDSSRTAFEEHLVEAAHTVCDQTGYCRLHITVSPENERTFKGFFEALRPTYENRHSCRFDVSFSFQDHGTDLLGVDFENNPLRQDNGELLFRPGGHGALLQNLNALQGDLIYIKNIDNILPDRLKETTIVWKKVLGGYLVKIEELVHRFLQKLIAGMDSRVFFDEVRSFCQDLLCRPEPPNFSSRSLLDRRGYWMELLNRPVRVCGMVKNSGEPGGGPFWVEDLEGGLSSQIVESAQVDFESPDQRAVWASSTHFNPVDLVCSVRDHQNQPFDLMRYRDADAVFITRKSYNGKDLKALELPGLWNGGMAGWLTLFVEVPDQTFCPVKTINDLLKSVHQPG